ncbi:MAG TPA: GDP-mannose 4,6-dehydratase, partial [Acidobacteriaceae bacterium]|nr:GDP-mannose 4,6-dehydratase [Acidobacteriaceae bacterium]
VIATGQQHSVREFVTQTANLLEMPLRWEGSGSDEKALNAAGEVVVAVDPRYFRPSEVDTLLGDATRAREDLGWQPRISFQQLVEEMVREDLKSAERDALVRKHGYSSYDRHEQ